ncbi:MAG: enoyl-CoA hydratase/isomerase family protein [Alphaproteobacteria bacterium]|nr:enoyl-CoA hydratase/isomerase family protein [Alphaproteobacteria bacterium]
MANRIGVEALVITLKIDRPAAHLTLDVLPVNALDMPALEELDGLLKRIEGNRDVRVLTIASGIKGLFCAGGDMKFWPREFPDRPDLVCDSGRRVFARIERLAQPTIALIDGKVIGDGLSLALACDLRVASHDSSFHLPELDYGFIPGWGTVGRMIREIGKAAASELLLIGEPVDAAIGLRMGLVHRVFDAQEICSATQHLAAGLANKPPMAMSQAKAALRGRTSDSTDGDWELDCFKAVWGGKEWAAGVARAFKVDVSAIEE